MTWPTDSAMLLDVMGDRARRRFRWLAPGFLRAAP